VTPLAGFDFGKLRVLLDELGADGWLLYDFRGANVAARRVLGTGGMGTRRLFVFLPRDGKPVAIVHRIELTPFEGFPGDVHPYSAWTELHALLRSLVGSKTVAMEISPRDAVPYLDRVPYGVVDLVTSFGARVVSSAPLVTWFAARWSSAELAGHRRAAAQVAEIAVDALRQAGGQLWRGQEVRETTLQRYVMDAFARAGLVTTHPPIAAFQANTADPHYEPQQGADRELKPGDLLLLDLWAREPGGAVFADQTWMAFAGRSPDPEITRVWQTVRTARAAAIAHLRARWRTGVTGAAVDDVPRAVIGKAGYGEFFLHRTGHSIDHELQGSGPHIDNFETSDTRPLIPGIGFSIEPGIYLPGRFGVRSEVNVHIDDDGPEVTPLEPQIELLLV